MQEAVRQPAALGPGGTERGLGACYPGFFRPGQAVRSGRHGTFGIMILILICTIRGAGRGFKLVSQELTITEP